MHFYVEDDGKHTIAAEKGINYTPKVTKLFSDENARKGLIKIN